MPITDKSILSPDTEPETGFTAGLSQSILKTSNLAQSLMGEPQQLQQPVVATKGIGAGIGELFNPVNLGLGLAGGEVIGAGAEALGSGISSTTGLTGEALSNTIGKTATSLVKPVTTGATEGAGWTLLNHYENTNSKLNDRLTTSDILGGAAIGGVLGGIGGAIGNALSKPETEAARTTAQTKVDDDYVQAINNVDTKLGTVTTVNGYEYNPQNKLGYNLKEDMPEKTPELPAPAKEVDADTAKKISDDFSDSSYAPKDGLPKDQQYIKDFIEKNKENLMQAKMLHDNGIELDSIPQRMENLRNEVEAHFSQMAIDAPKQVSQHLYDPSNNLNIRNVLFGDLTNASPLDIEAAKLYNQIDKSLIDEAQNNGMDIGYVDGYIRQVHDPDRMRMSSADEWANAIQPKLANEIDIPTLKSVYYKLLNKDVGDIFAPLNPNNPIKERVFTFKDAQSQMDYENQFGFKKDIGTHMVDNVKGLSNKVSMIRLLGEGNQQDVMKFLGKIQGRTSSEIKNVIEQVTATRMQPEIGALSKAVGLLTATNKFIKAIFSPGYVLTHIGTDAWTAIAHGWGKFGISNTTRSLMEKPPTKDIQYMSNLPFEGKETFKNFINEFRNAGRIEHISALGGQIRMRDKTTPVLKMEQRAYLKLGAMHLLDNMMRKMSLRIATYSIKTQYKLNGLAKLLPKTNQDILRQAVNEQGELVPRKLDEIANTIEDKTLQKQYRMTSDKLKNIYAGFINDVNPIYSAMGAKFNKFDPAVTAGARTMMWGLRMYGSVYGDMVKNIVSNNNRLQASSALAASVLGLSAIGMATDHIINKLEGEPDREETMPVINDKLKQLIPNDNARSFGINVAKNIFPLTAMYNAPLVYGTLADAVRAGGYEIDGKSATAESYVKKAIPAVHVLTNIWANHTEADEAETRRRIRGYE